MSIVRENLMTVEGYSPYCGNERCALNMPRTSWNGAQFECKCGWVSKFPDDFVAKYKAKWKKEKPPCSESTR